MVFAEGFEGWSRLPGDRLLNKFIFLFLKFFLVSVCVSREGGQKERENVKQDFIS